MAPQTPADEETPLLHAQQQKRVRTPLPLRQILILLLLQLAEPLTSQVISPFAPQLIRDIGVTHGDETKVGYYVGMLHSLFFATQALTILHWSRLSDHIGRKPVILIGLFGLSLSMYCFGLSKTFVGLVLSRALNGALNGNVGILKSMVAEITDETNIAQAYAYMPLAWSSGGTLGPLIGGSLSRPADRFPDLFGNVEFFKTYPYFLACAVPATFTAIAWIIMFFFLEETHPRRIPFGKLIRSKFGKKRNTGKSSVSAQSSTETLAGNEHSQAIDENTPLPLRAVLIPRVLIAAGNYAMLSMTEIAFRTVQPLFYSTPIELGGLGLDPPLIGNILSTYGLLNGVFQIFFFRPLHDRFGSKAIYTTAMLSGIPLILTFPLIHALGNVYGVNWAVWCMIGLQVVFSVALNVGYSCIFIYIAASSPNRGSLGATNGVAQMVVSIMRTFGPGSAASVFSISIERPGNWWIVHSFLMAFVFVSIGASLLLPRKLWKN